MVPPVAGAGAGPPSGKVPELAPALDVVPLEETPLDAPPLEEEPLEICGPEVVPPLEEPDDASEPLDGVPAVGSKLPGFHIPKSPPFVLFGPPQDASAPREIRAPSQAHLRVIRGLPLGAATFHEPGLRQNVDISRLCPSNRCDPPDQGIGSL
jgi:hypothetical protein